MIKVYICPKCGWVREVSRRKIVECHKCGARQMTLTNLLYEDFIHLSPKERDDFSKNWMNKQAKKLSAANREPAHAK